MKKVHLEVFPLLARGLAGGRDERLVLEQMVRDDASLGVLIDQIVSERPELAEALLDNGSDRIRQQIVVSLNEELLPLAGALDTLLHDGDRVFLLMAMPGG